jgi:hypothetical protein
MQLEERGKGLFVATLGALNKAAFGIVWADCIPDWNHINWIPIIPI